MPSVSKAQQRFMGLVHAYKKGEVPASKVSQAVKDAAKSMKKKSTKDFASTKHDDLPDKVREYLMSENPAASAAAAMAMMQLQNPDTGKKVSAITPLRDKDHKLHKKSKGIFQRLKDKFMKKNESINEDGHTDVASAERKLKLIMKDAMDTLNALRSLSNEDSLPSWWTDKITLAKDYVGKSRDYIMNPAEGEDEGFGGELTSKDKKKFEKARKENAEQLGYELTGTSDVKESVDEKKNPKREKLKKDFNKGLLALEKRVRRVKQFAKSNDWGRVSAFVEDGLVNDIEDLARYTSEISTLPVDESINEESKTIKSIQNLADKNKYGTVSGTRMNGKTAKEIIAIYNHPKMKSFRGKMDKLKSHELMDLTIRLPKILGIKVESVNENMKDVMKNAIHQVKTFDKPSNAKLMTIKVINKLKEKRNSSKSTSNKKQLQKMINKVESDYKKGKYLKESVNEVSGVDVAKRVLKNKQYEKGIDLQTANLIVTIDKAYDKNPKLQKKFRALQLPKMKQLILKYYG